jgi:hypothetical protein
MWVPFAYAAYHFFKRDRAFERTTCPHCGKRVRVLQSYSAWEFVAIYFIPVLPFGSIRAVMKCPSCLQCDKYALKGRKLKAARAECLGSAMHHVRTRDAAGILSDVTALCHLGDYSGAQHVLEELERSDERAIAEIGWGRLHEMRREAPEAERHYRLAAQADSSLDEAHVWLGRFLLNQERDSEAVAELARYGRPDARLLEYLIDMADLRMRQKKWDGMAVVLGEILRINPAAGQSKAFADMFRKAQKRGRSWNQDLRLGR